MKERLTFARLRYQPLRPAQIRRWFADIEVPIVRQPAKLLLWLASFALLPGSHHFRGPIDQRQLHPGQ